MKQNAHYAIFHIKDYKEKPQEFYTAFPGWIGKIFLKRKIKFNAEQLAISSKYINLIVYLKLWMNF